VRNGFDSKTFSGLGAVSFNISEIRNPKTSDETGAFTLQIFDSQDIQYQYQGTDLTFKIRPSDFQYS
jgi:hypothetical protein